jgi:DNA-nicking Smr family endonuclease
MDFGEILDKWDNAGGTAGGIDHKDTELDAKKEKPAQRRSRLLRKSPDETIDLHGLTRDEAWDALEAFFTNARNENLEKLLIIHGKGNHATQKPEEAGILRETVRDFIERCPYAGESGYSSASRGGSGSSWVLLKVK